uniref:kirola-like n=1 Tax=Erigeron canadensis TaxID=72917 RepID=UPI001CB92F69|nr:kirola-like [Erigeron canadensis]
MTITGTLVQEVDIKCHGNLLHDIYKHKLHETAIISPDKVRRCDLVTGEWGAPGSVISWDYIYDGKVNTVKEVIEAVDDDNHKIVFKVIEGELLKVYNAFILTIHIKNRGQKQFVTWTLDFEKLNSSIPDPSPYLDLVCAFTKDIDAYILKLA